jgi:hypothetical protein
MHFHAHHRLDVQYTVSYVVFIAHPIICEEYDANAPQEPVTREWSRDCLQ